MDLRKIDWNAEDAWDGWVIVDYGAGTRWIGRVDIETNNVDSEIALVLMLLNPCYTLATTVSSMQDKSGRVAGINKQTICSKYDGTMEDVGVRILRIPNAIIRCEQLSKIDKQFYSELIKNAEHLATGQRAQMTGIVSGLQ